MQKFQILFETSPWFIIFCFLVGAAYAYLLYQNKSKGPWGKNINYILTGLRFALTSILCFLLLGPFVRQIKNTIEAPTYIIAIDNSASIEEITDSLKTKALAATIQELGNKLKNKNLNISYRTFDGEKSDRLPEDLKFNYKSTDLSSLLRNIQNDYEGKNLGGVILFTDGIYNMGMSPDYSPYSFKIYTVGLGDTIPQKDINLKTVYHNKISYQGNKMPLMAEIAVNGFEDKEIKVRVKQGGKILQEKVFVPKKENEIKELEFHILAENKGLQHYVVEVVPHKEEFTAQNNLKHIYVDVVEGKQKVLMIALSPHPDIKAIRSAIETNENYEFHLFIPGVNTFKENKYDLVIFHQIPDNVQSNSEIIRRISEKISAHWYIVGSQTSLPRLNNINQAIQINAMRNEKDNVFPSYNPSFDKFTFSEGHLGTIDDFPPVSVPFGKVEITTNTDVILYQRVGKIITDKPLLVVNNTNEKKTAVMLGEGLWQWRLYEYSRKEKHEVFNELMLKLVQYLSTKEDKRKFKVYPVKNEFYDTESTIFEAEVYNDIYERIYHQKVDLTITDEDNNTKNYSFVPNEANSRFKINGLRQGVYKYSASTEIKGQKEISQGEFTIRELQIESLSLTANHTLLKRLSKETGGKFYLPDGLKDLEKDLEINPAKGVVHSFEDNLEIIHMKWLFFLILGFAGFEWFLRKYHGAY